MIDESAICQRFAALQPVLDERGRRRLAAVEALTAGHGGTRRGGGGGAGHGHCPQHHRAGSKGVAQRRGNRGLSQIFATVTICLWTPDVHALLTI